MSERTHPRVYRRQGQPYRPILTVTDAQIFGERIRVLRQERELTQERLAGKADLTTGFVNSIEHGRKVPSLTTILKLAKALELGGGDLLADFDAATVRRLKFVTR